MKSVIIIISTIFMQDSLFGKDNTAITKCKGVVKPQNSVLTKILRDKKTQLFTLATTHSSNF